MCQISTDLAGQSKFETKNYRDFFCNVTVEQKSI